MTQSRLLFQLFPTFLVFSSQFSKDSFNWEARKGGIFLTLKTCLFFYLKRFLISLRITQTLMKPFYLVSCLWMGVTVYPLFGKQKTLGTSPASGMFIDPKIVLRGNKNSNMNLRLTSNQQECFILFPCYSSSHLLLYANHQFIIYLFRFYL